jgi:threonine dehydrogenase-like Zn-dependent dehydrogenase
MRLHGVRDARIDDIAEPTIRPGTVKVRVALAGICGSDLSFFQEPYIPVDAVHPTMNEAGPKVLGHEFSGKVVEVADGVEGVAVGDLVAIRPSIADGTCAACLRGQPNLCENWGFIGLHGWGGGFSEFVVAPLDNVYRLPAGVTAEAGAMAEPLAVAWAAVRRSGATDGSVALVVGAGPVGLCLLLCLQAVGASRVVVSEISEGRRAMAERLGAEVIDPRQVDAVEHLRSVTYGSGADVSFDASGAGPVTFDAALDALRPGGTSVVVAMSHQDVPLDPNRFLNTEKHLTGSFAYLPEDFGAVIDALGDGRIDPLPLVTSTIALEDAVEKGIEHLLGDGRSTEVKVLVSPEPVA